MPQSRFVLKEPNSKNETLVYLLYRFNNTKLKYSTGQKIYPNTGIIVEQRDKGDMILHLLASLARKVEDMACIILIILEGFIFGNYDKTNRLNPTWLYMNCK